MSLQINKIKRQMTNTVETFDGKIVLLKDCKKLNGLYYVKDVDCVFIGDKWYLKTESYIKYDEEIKKWILDKSGKLTNGIIGFKDDDSNEPIMGYYSRNRFKNCLVYTANKNQYSCINYDLIDKKVYKEVLNQQTMTFAPVIIHHYFGEKLQKFHFEKQGYNIEECGDFIEQKQNYAAFNTVIEKSTLKVSKLLGGLSFGCESETECGLLPNNIKNQLGVVICKDGSIEYSPEYVTVPYSGAKGLQSLKNFFVELENRCTTNHKCSLHYHFGNTRKDREFVLALYKLFHDIQGELFKMLPYYKKYYKGYKKQNYTKPLVNIIPMYDRNGNDSYKSYINKTYIELFKYLNSGILPGSDYNRKNHNHSQGNTKWNISTRYSALNFIPMLFSNRETVEFRMLQGTVNKTKGINWFFICLAILKYADKNSTKILTDLYKENTLKEVLSVYPESSGFQLSEYLYSYYVNRVSYHENRIKNGDLLSEREYTDEKNFRFTAAGVTDIY